MFSSTVSNYRLFCISLIQRYIAPEEGIIQDVFDMFYDEKGPKFMTRAQFDKLPESEKRELRKEIMDVHDRVLDVFKGIPSNLLLIFRYSTAERLFMWAQQGCMHFNYLDF